jgi:hypothetical protein
MIGKTPRAVAVKCARPTMPSNRMLLVTAVMLSNPTTAYPTAVSQLNDRPVSSSKRNGNFRFNLN